MGLYLQYCTLVPGGFGQLLHLRQPTLSNMLLLHTGLLKCGALQNFENVFQNASKALTAGSSGSTVAVDFNFPNICTLLGTIPNNLGSLTTVEKYVAQLFSNGTLQNLVLIQA